MKQKTSASVVPHASSTGTLGTGGGALIPRVFDERIHADMYEYMMNGVMHSVIVFINAFMGRVGCGASYLLCDREALPECV